MMAASPAQNASGEIPVFGAASLAMKSNRTGAIFNPWASMRFMMVFLAEMAVLAPLTRRQQNGPHGAAFGPFSPKARALKRPPASAQMSMRGEAATNVVLAKAGTLASAFRYPNAVSGSCAVEAIDSLARRRRQWTRSNIRGEVRQFVEQHAGCLQHLLDLIRGLSDRPLRGIDHELGRLGRLVVVADAGKAGKRAGAGLLVVALGIAALADFGRCCDMDLAERAVGDATAVARSSRAGETAATMAMWPLRARCVATSARRRMFSLRSAAESRDRC